MKKTIKLAAIALVAMSLTVACKSKATEVVEDTTPIEEMVIEDVVDTLEEVAEEVVPEEPVKKVTKKTTTATNSPASVKPTDLNKVGTADQSTKGSAKKVEQKVTPTNVDPQASATPETKKGK
ncbi:MAG: hypothetical protein J6X79_00145 [Bacteroidales bacterium]|nr:hypothetical protein [Bacteroidales bacterium]